MVEESEGLIAILEKDEAHPNFEPFMQWAKEKLNKAHQSIQPSLF